MSMLAPLTLLERLIAFPTVSHRSNLELSDFIANALDAPALRVHQQASGDGSKRNLVIEIGPQVDPEKRDGLVLSGHMDVVPANESQWQSDPFALRDAGARLYGRGTADMKGFIALAVSLAAEFARRSLTSPLVLVLTRDEEVGTRGARQLAMEWSRALPRNAVIGEPTSLRPVRMHKGHASFRVELHGRAAHSAYPHLGKNAIGLAAKTVAALEGLADELRDERAPTSRFFGDVPFVPLNVGTIAGGRAINIVPDACCLEFGLRALPGMDTEALFARVRERLAAALPSGAYECELVDESPPLLLDAEAPIHRHVCELMGSSVDEGASYATDGGWLQQLGLDCLIWGPGSIEDAHRPNEFVTRGELERAEAYLRRLIAIHCEKTA